MLYARVIMYTQSGGETAQVLQLLSLTMYIV